MALEGAKRSKRFNKLYSEDHRLIPTLPPEILVDIFTRLPVESLLRCKSVCKSWCSLISDPYFIKSHLSLSASNNHYAHHRLISTTVDRNSIHTYPLDDVLHDRCVDPVDHCIPSKQLKYEPFVSIVGCCNGLVCVCMGVYAMFIWNPATRIWNRLYCGLRDVVYGFGYDASSNDYKVVAIARYETQFNKTNKVKIYSLKTASWRKVGDFPRKRFLNDSGKFTNGALHWVVRGPLIVSIDLADETFSEVLPPQGSKHLILGVLGDCLCVLFNHADVWVMKVKDSWTKLFSILNPSELPFATPLFISNDGKLLLRWLSRLVVYDSKIRSWSKFQIFNNCFEANTLVESLVSPRSSIRWNLRKRRIS